MSKEMQIEEMAKAICFATQKTNYSCNEICEKRGCCAYCKVMAEFLYAENCRKQSEPFSCSHEKGVEWISVDERLPDIDERCLLSMENRITKYRWVVIGYYHTNYDEYVTHWMPLPEPPKKGGAE